MLRFTLSGLALLAALAAPRHGPLAVTPQASSPDATLAAARELVARVIPGRAGEFRLERIDPDSGRDTFEAESRGDTVVLRGTTGVAIASALDWYLEHAAGLNIGTPLEPVALPHPLPRLDAPVHRTTPYRYRYFFNYCTFAYSMAWWDWPDWQRMIDWMAMKGINLPLAVTGQEAVWQRVLADFGFSRRQIADFLVGPAYFPWGWMGNIDGLGGPLPQRWIDSHVALERKILARERSLGMTPVLQGFTGHVPRAITAVIPGAKVHQTGDWSAGFSGTWFLDPMDPLFQRFGRRFIQRQAELFGTDHHYAADPFNEINPPTSDSAFLARMGGAIYGAMASADSGAVWILQGWFLYYQADFWRRPQAQALLGAVPDGRMIVLDLYGDRNPVWRRREAFYGKPWIWNVLYNFGGQVTLNGDLPRIAANLDSALQSPEHGRMDGLGMTMEGLGYNAIVPDFVLDQTWRSRVPPIEPWARAWVDRRYGGHDPRAWSAWQILLATAYRSGPQTGTFLAERPQFYDRKAAYRTQPVPPYPAGALVPALDSLLAASDSLAGNDAYRYDVVNLTRQVLGSLGLPLVDSVQAAYRRGDRSDLLRAEGRVLALLADMDTLVATRREFLLGPWLEDAKHWGTTEAERRLYEWNARNLITLWGTKCTEGENDDLNLYAYKQWAGMFSGYYLPRWREFFRRLNSALEAGTPFDRAPFAAWSCEWEKTWSKGSTRYPVSPRGDGLQLSRTLLARYRPALMSELP